MAVFAGLTQYTVARMKQSWSVRFLLIPPALSFAHMFLQEISQELEESWEKLESLCSPIGNFKNLRDIHDKARAPCVKSPSALFI
jgi:hypothetical protein